MERISDDLKALIDQAMERKDMSVHVTFKPDDVNVIIIPMNEAPHLIVANRLSDKRNRFMCSECGAELKDPYLYCPYCGEKLKRHN